MTERPPAEAPLDFECELADPPEKVWRALTEPELLAAWMMPNDITPEVGSRFAFAGPEAPIECEVLEAEPGRLLRYSWRERPGADDADKLPALDSIVTFTLARTVSGGTHLRIVHDGFARTPAVVMAGAGCRLAFNAQGAGRAIAANAPLLRRAA
ncbi:MULTISPECIES: SRPBCC domain-containing protein [unclassified Mesorhizobium]|uniref:SRPBCC family protein n=1 Tax=Mesorhizobium TaxID=68287 RepID=UPI000FCBF05E|nr:MULTISPECIES: SRPBCC domain-containing protein [unclassified Mesorhizobium]RUW18007.1 SRPBCC domain-containing protein [Mesorhizobium sp. M4B.F.Ca.ET.013.02.1.1]RUW67869.1 SRPBCC domain-containing protein [Mesorhizobium sp. M4B.F.Ca.ET.049.02.1.2]RVD20473.1 SRPBCC domain-containing protein [Mesorhizobium sp. M4B.F.Ca.ET.017.02.2.1]RVD33259.1 SRPBCC domain-containing protein [Mesorhizobium sp. M4B.F.Ca.ET.019.03.1.1]RWC96382.1 MAG: SRPBCC domain-containing protein [Mesorhizobium sp.]